MSSRARRIRDPQHIAPFAWPSAPQTGVGRRALPAASLHEPQPAEVAPAPVAVHVPDIAAIERDAFAQGYAQGERAGAEAAAARSPWA
jgi:hypothetical protein